MASPLGLPGSLKNGPRLLYSKLFCLGLFLREVLGHSPEMDFTLTEDQRLFADSVRGVAERHFVDGAVAVDGLIVLAEAVP